MSNRNNQQAEAQNQSQQKREPYHFALEEPIPFNAVISTQILTSDQFCAQVSDAMKFGFADYEGCQFETRTGNPEVVLLFNHKQHDNATIPVACVNSANASGKDGSPSLLAQSRLRDQRVKSGDRYELTQDGQDVIKNLLDVAHYNGGNIKWGNIVSEYQEPINGMNFYGRMNTAEYTKVSGLDINRLAAFLYGTKDDNDIYQYHIDIKAPQQTPQSIYGPVPYYVFEIQKIGVNAVTAARKNLGIGVSATSTIIR